MAEPNQSSPAQLSKRRCAEKEERREYPKHTTSQCRGTCIMSLQEFNEVATTLCGGHGCRYLIPACGPFGTMCSIWSFALVGACYWGRVPLSCTHAKQLSAVTPQLQMISAVYPQAAKVRRVRKVLSLSGQPGFCSYDSYVMFYAPPPVFQSAVIHSLCRFGRTALQYAYFLPDLWTAEKTPLTESSHFQRHLEAWQNAWLSSIRLGCRSIGTLYWHRSTDKNKITNKKDDQWNVGVGLSAYASASCTALPELEAPSRNVMSKPFFFPSTSASFSDEAICSFPYITENTSPNNPNAWRWISFLYRVNVSSSCLDLLFFHFLFRFRTFKLLQSVHNRLTMPNWSDSAVKLWWVFRRFRPLKLHDTTGQFTIASRGACRSFFGSVELWPWKTNRMWHEDPSDSTWMDQ